MTVVDISGWEPADDEPLGTKPKHWVRSPTGELWLWKQSTVQRDDLHGPYRKGDDWSEVVAGRIGEALGIPVARVELATRSADYGVISRTVLTDVRRETLVHGNELLSEVGIGSGNPRDRTGYTIEAVAGVLTGVGPSIASHDFHGAFDWFAGYLVLDALVGNTDRHQDNWATIRGPEGQRLAPSFDHASCLGFQLSDQERIERLGGRGKRTVESYAVGARTKFQGHPTPIEAATRALSIVGSNVRTYWKRVVDMARDLGANVAAGIPTRRMGEASRAFADALYRHNQAALSYRLRTMDA